MQPVRRRHQPVADSGDQLGETGARQGACANRLIVGPMTVDRQSGTCLRGSEQIDLVDYAQIGIAPKHRPGLLEIGHGDDEVGVLQQAAGEVKSLRLN